jgi:hypothetical protein
MTGIDLRNSQITLSASTGGETLTPTLDVGVGGDDDESVPSIDGDDEAEEADLAVANADADADADAGNPELAKVAQEKVTSLEKQLVVLRQRRGQKITSAVWHNGTLLEASLVKRWKRRSKRWGKFCFCLFHSLFTSSNN